MDGSWSRHQNSESQRSLPSIYLAFSAKRTIIGKTLGSKNITRLWLSVRPLERYRDKANISHFLVESQVQVKYAQSADIQYTGRRLPTSARV
jgi:hypothetical protein